jgi:hypothetical protein
MDRLAEVIYVLTSFVNNNARSLFRSFHLCLRQSVADSRCTVTSKYLIPELHSAFREPPQTTVTEGKSASRICET